MDPSTPLLTVTIWVLLLSSSVFTASELSLVVSGTTSLQITPNIVVEQSPGLNLGTKVKCERVQIQGLSRNKHWRRFANSVKVKVSYVSPKGRPPNIQVCFHRNFSLGIGMCPQGQWEKLSDGLWVRSMSPFDHKILDIRMGASYSENLQVFLDEEFFWYRILFLVLGVLFLSLASFLSKSPAFYYCSAMTIGVLLMILIVLFQGMKLLPTGRKSSLAIFIYSCFVGLGSFLFRYIPSLLKSLLIEFGLSEDIYDPLVICLLVFLTIIGAWFGFWVVRKHIRAEDGSIDAYVSQFVYWSIRIVASLLILQCSLDPLFAAEALIGGIFISSSINRFLHSKALTRAYRKFTRVDNHKVRRRESLHASSPDKKSTVLRPVQRYPRTPVPAPVSTSVSSDSETFYSSYHETPDRRKFTKEEWDHFTKDSTQRALENLVSSPDFTKWAVSNADRITLAPNNETENNWRRWFNW